MAKITEAQRQKARAQRDARKDADLLASVQDVLIVDPKTGKVEPAPPGPSLDDV